MRPDLIDLVGIIALTLAVIVLAYSIDMALSQTEGDPMIGPI